MELIKELGFKKLPTRTEFDIELSSRKLTYSKLWLSSTEYLGFLQQKPELWMFVPAIKKDGVWVVLEKPELYKDARSNSDIEARRFEYNEALDRVLFDGWKLEGINRIEATSIRHKDEPFSLNISFYFGGDVIFNGRNNYTTLEQAVNNGIELKLK